MEFLKIIIKIKIEQNVPKLERNTQKNNMVFFVDFLTLNMCLLFYFYFLFLSPLQDVLQDKAHKYNVFVLLLLNLVFFLLIFGKKKKVHIIKIYISLSFSVGIPAALYVVHLLLRSHKKVSLEFKNFCRNSIHRNVLNTDRKVLKYVYEKTINKQ